MGRKIRESEGSGSEIRGQLFIRVTDRPQHRTAKRVPWATSLPEADERAKLVQSWVNRLRRAGQNEYVEKIIELGAAAETSERLAEIAANVDALAGGDFDRVEAPPTPQDLTVQADAWLLAVTPLYDEKTHKTLKQYAARWPEWFGPQLADMANDAALARWLARRLGEVLAKTVRKEIGYIRSFLTWCVGVARVLAKLPTFPKVPKKATGVRAGVQRENAVELTEEQVASILGKLRDRSWPRYAFMAETGLRPETIDALSTPEHYVKDRATLKIDDADDKARFGRELPLSPRAREILDALCAVQDKPGRLFGGVFGPRRFYDFKDAVAACGLPEQTAPYDLRHAKVTHALEASGNLPGVAYLVGHKQITTTNKYAHANRRAAESVLASMLPRSGSKHGSTGTPGDASPAEKLSDSEGVTDGFRTRDNWSHNPSVPGDPSPTRADSRDDASGARRDSATSEGSLPRSAAASIADLEGAIGNLTRLLATTDDAEAAAEIIAERKAMRRELDALKPTNVVDIASRKKSIP